MTRPVPADAPPVPTGVADDPAGAVGVAVLARGVLVVRWAVLVWMAALVGNAAMAGREPGVPIAITTLTVVAVWIVWLTVTRPSATMAVLLIDLLVAAAAVVVGARLPWFATVYPVTAALAWGAARGVGGGLAAGAALGIVAVGAGLSVPDGPTSAQLIPSLRDPVYFLLAGGGLGFVAALLERSAAQVRAAQIAQVRATERAARAMEREALGRQIHDSVLQTLALVHKRGRELAGRPSVDGAEVGRLADLAASQERALRSLILRPADDGPRDEGRTPLRERLERAADSVDGELATAVSATGDIRLPATYVSEIGAAVEQALRNVVRHASASHAWVFAEIVDTELIVTVRDDGRGFTFDPEALRTAGKFGLLRSIGGRADDLGGTLQVDTAPGRGTELEIRIPLPAAASGDDRSDRAADGDQQEHHDRP